MRPLRRPSSIALLAFASLAAAEPAAPPPPSGPAPSQPPAPSASSVAPASAASLPVLDWDRLIASVETAPDVLAARRQSTALEATDGLVLWDELELRYDLKQANFDKQEVDLRVSPLGWGERRAARTLWGARRELAAARAEDARTEAILDRCRAGLSWLFQNRQTAYHRARRDIVELRVQTLERLAGDTRFNARELVSSLQKRVEAEAALVADGNDLAERAAHLHLLAPAAGDIALDTLLVTPGEIRTRVEAMAAVTDSAHPGLRIAARDLGKTMAEIDLDAAADRRWISYLQAGYEWDATLNAKKRDAEGALGRFAAGVGVRIPLFDGSRRAAAMRKAEAVEARIEFIQERQELERNLADLRKEIGVLLRERAVLDSFTAQIDAGELFADFAERSGADPLLVLQSRETSIESAWRSEELWFEILDKYLELLDLTGELPRGTGSNPLRPSK